MFDCYKEGYEKGFSDAENGKARNPKGFPIAKSLMSENCVNTFIEGYNKGYADGIAKKHNVYNK